MGKKRIKLEKYKLNQEDSIFYSPKQKIEENRTEQVLNVNFPKTLLEVL